MYSTAGVIILKISHGYEVREENDPFVDLADQALQQFSASTAPGAFLVDLLPIRMFHHGLLPIVTSDHIAVKHVPAWFPGADFKRKAAAWNACLQRTVNEPYNFVKSQIVSRPIFVLSSSIELTIHCCRQKASRPRRSPTIFSKTRSPMR